MWGVVVVGVVVIVVVVVELLKPPPSEGKWCASPVARGQPPTNIKSESAQQCEEDHVAPV